MFMNDMADTYPVDSALFGAEDLNAADSLVDFSLVDDGEGDSNDAEGDDGEGDSNDDASSDGDDSDSSTSGVAGAKDSKKTGTTDTFVGSSSGTYHKGDEVPAPSQPSEARKATTPVKGAKKPAKIPPVAKPAKASPGNSTMGGAGSRPPRQNSTSASILASSPHFIPSGNDTVVDDAPEPLQPDEASKAAKQVKASGASAAVAAFPMMSLSKAAPGGGGDGYEKEITAPDDDEDEVISTLLCIHLTLYRHHQYSLFELSSIHAKSVCYDAFWIILGIIQKVLVWTFSECKHLCELPASHIASAPPSPTSSFLARHWRRRIRT